MWDLTMFDLPVDKKAARRAYTVFRKALLKDGFTRMQFSVYVRHFASEENSDVHVRRVERMEHLTAAPAELGQTAHYWFHVGLARHRLDQWAAAFEAFQKCIDVDSGKGRAWAFAADCLFRLEQPVKGLDYAKEAAHRGIDLALREWQERQDRSA
jgi:tetratricopeptide (TPR) repeat protein